jgi:hypothetical protein
MNIKTRAAFDVAVFLVATAILCVAAYLAPWVIGVWLLATFVWALYVGWGIRVAQLTMRDTRDKLEKLGPDNK